MASLIETPAAEGLLPLTVGAATLCERPSARITSLAPFSGADAAVATALKALGLGWPGPGQSVTGEGAQVLWSGRGQAFLVGADPAGLRGLAALTDQSDGWARLGLEGAGATAVLARLVPLDLGARAFPTGSVARSGLNHMMMVLTRDDTDAFTIMVFRSMTRSAVHEIGQAMAACAARAAL